MSARTGEKIILIVDDEISFSRIYVKHLEMNKFQAGYVTTGESAIEFVRSVMPSLILIDLKLPDMNGVELLRRLRSEGYEGPAIAISGYMMDIIDVEKFGFVCGLAKPFELQPFIDAVTQCLSSSSSSL